MIEFKREAVVREFIEGSSPDYTFTLTRVNGGAWSLDIYQKGAWRLTHLHDADVKALQALLAEIPK